MDHYEAALKKVRQVEERAQLLVQTRIDARTAELVFQILHLYSRGLDSPGFSMLIHDYVVQFGQEVVDMITAEEKKLASGVLEFWNTARKATEKEEDMSSGVILTLGTVGVSVLIGLTKKWKTAISQDAFVKAWKVLSLAWRDKTSPDDLARQLRQFVQEPVAYNSTRIAFSELHNLRGKEEAKLFQNDPFVEAVQWTLSPNRGNWNPPDECDILAGVDFYGLGKGIYPVFKIPGTPHPWDRCEKLPVRRSPRKFSEPKPNPNLILDPLDPEMSIPNGSRITAAAGKYARESAWYALSNPL